MTWTTGVPQLRRLAFELAAIPWMAEAPCRGSEAFMQDEVTGQTVYEAYRDRQLALPSSK